MGEQKGKDVLIIHLESISRTNLWQYRNELGTVWRLLSQSLQFNRFFSSATSTVMAVTDMFFGDSSTMDIFGTYSSSRGKQLDIRKFLDLRNLLSIENIASLCFGTSPYSRQEESIGPFIVRVNNANVPALCDTALREMKRRRDDGIRFCAYFWDDSSHLAFPSPQKDAVDGVAERLRVAYALVDASLNRLLSGMAALGLWENLIIIGLGDHGDEAWSHGLNRGYCHSLVPYASLTWTPMFIYDPERFESSITGQLASMVDIAPTVLSMILPDRPPRPRLTEFAGIDLMREKRKYAFSQNMFALQCEYSDPEKGMVKGYAVTDGNYRLVVHSGGRDPGSGGMELYCDQADPSNSLNLLKFFKLGKEGEIRRFAPPPDAVAKHFTTVFGQPQVESVQKIYTELKAELKNFVKAKEQSALQERQRLMESSVEELDNAFIEAGGKYLRVKANESIAGELGKLKEAISSQTIHLFPDEAFTRVRTDYGKQ